MVRGGTSENQANFTPIVTLPKHNTFPHPLSISTSNLYRLQAIQFYGNQEGGTEVGKAVGFKKGKKGREGTP
jgi:hypothetical protein